MKKVFILMSYYTSPRRDESKIYDLVDPNGRYRYKIGRIILLKENDFSIDFVQSYKHQEDTWRL